jgi:MFS family permease
MERPRFGEEFATVGLVTAGHFLSHFYLLAFPPLFSLIRPEFGLSNAQLGLVVSVISVAMLLQIPVGELVDRIGGKWVFVGGVAVTSLGVLLAGTATSYLALLAFATLSGIGQATFHPADYPLLETVSEPERRGRNFSIHTFGGYVGFAAAPVVVGTLGIALGWRTALLIVGSVGVAYAGVVALALRPVYRQQIDASVDTDDDGGASSRAALLRPGILVMSVFFVVFTMAGKGIQTFTPILAVDGFRLTESIGNTALSVFFAVTAIAVLLGGVIADRHDPRHIIAAATTMAAATLFVVVGDVVPIDAIAVIVLFGLAGGAYGLVFASRDRLVSSYSPSGSTGRSFGFVFTASSLGSLSSPVLLGAVIDVSTPSTAFVLIGGFFLLSGLVVLAIGAAPASLSARLPSRSE